VEKSLKEQNRWPLWSLMLANLAIFYGMVENNTIFVGDWHGLVSNIEKAIPAGIGIALTGILNAQFSPNAKYRIVFMRWHNPLPGCEAFTHYAKSDPRVDYSSLERLYGPLPADPSEQNALWYKLYRSVESDVSVIQVHRSFLFTRDYACLGLVAFFVLGVFGIWHIPTTRMAFIYLAALLIQFLLAGQAARNHGKRFVTTVLAIAETRQEGRHNE